MERGMQYAVEREGPTVKVALHCVGEVDFVPAYAIALLAKGRNFT